MIKLIHFADLHLNAPLSSRVGWEVSVRLRENKYKVIDRIVALAKEKEVDLILVAGDLFDDAFTDEKTFRFLADRFAKTQARIFLACGNHDCLSKNQIAKYLPENCHLFGGEMERISLPELSCDVYGQSFVTEVQRESMLSGFHAEQPDILNLMVMHGEVQHHSDYNPIHTEDIEKSGLDFLALGHIHNEKEVHRAGKTRYAFAGIPQPHTFKDSSAPSVSYLELSKEEFRIEYIDLSEFRFYQLEVSVSDCLTSYEIQEAILQKTQEYDRRRHLFEITLTGELPEQFSVDLRQLEEELAPSFLHIELHNNIRIKINRKALLAEQTLRGAFARLLEQEETLSPQEKQEILECGIHAANPLITKEGLL